MDIMDAKDLKDYEVILKSNSMLEKIDGITNLDELSFKLNSAIYHVIVIRDIRDMTVKPRGKFHFKDLGTIKGEKGVRPVCVGLDTTDGTLKRKNFHTEKEVMDWLKDDYKDIYSNEDVDSLDKMYKVYDKICEFLMDELYYRITYDNGESVEEPESIYSFDHDIKGFILMIDEDSLTNYIDKYNEGEYDVYHGNLVDKLVEGINERLNRSIYYEYSLKSIMVMTDKEYQEYNKWKDLQLT